MKQSGFQVLLSIIVCVISYYPEPNQFRVRVTQRIAWSVHSGRALWNVVVVQRGAVGSNTHPGQALAVFVQGGVGRPCHPPQVLQHRIVAQLAAFSCSPRQLVAMAAPKPPSNAAHAGRCARIVERTPVKWTEAISTIKQPSCDALTIVV